jgi:hypothetical protein
VRTIQSCRARRSARGGNGIWRTVVLQD